MKKTKNQEIIKIQPGLEVLYRYAPKGNNTSDGDADEKYYISSIVDIMSRRYCEIHFCIKIKNQ